MGFRHPAQWCGRMVQLSKADTDQDGVISKEEFVAYMLEDLELDDDGKLEEEAVAEVRRQIATLRSSAAVLVARDVEEAEGAGDATKHGTASMGSMLLIGSLFDAVDTDGSGTVERAEADRLFTVMGAVGEELQYYWDDLVRRSRLAQPHLHL